MDAKAIKEHIRILGHEGFGVTELRVFDPYPKVAYVDNPDIAVKLCRSIEHKTKGIYVGVQPRPVDLYEHAPDKWMPARAGSVSRCASDSDIEYITACFWDIDVVSPARQKGFPASDSELKHSLQAAGQLSALAELKDSSVICCSGNGHYLVARLCPVSVDDCQMRHKFKSFCDDIARPFNNIEGIRIDAVYNLSRVMRLIGTNNRKGIQTERRPYRQACFVGDSNAEKSLALHYMIFYAPVSQIRTHSWNVQNPVECDLSKLSECEFLIWCRKYPQLVSQGLWFGLITNLAYLEGGLELIHEISALDNIRYDYSDTQAIIERVLSCDYKPVRCENLMAMPAKNGAGTFNCSRKYSCNLKAPMYMAAIRTVYQR